jgi:hypothetical protein
MVFRCDRKARGLRDRAFPVARRSTAMTKRRCSKNGNLDPAIVMSLALVRYHFTTPEIRLLMRHVIGHALSARTIKRLARSAGNVLKRGRPPTKLSLHKGDMSDLIEATSSGIDGFNNNTLQLFHHIQVQFGLTPRQYLMWVAKFIRRGKYMMRKCLLCAEFFPSSASGERHCKECQPVRHHLVKEQRRSVLN